MSFRQYGGINYAAKNNIVKNNYSNANNLSVMTKVGQPSSYINFESDISGNTIYGPYDFQGDVSITGTLTVSKDALINGLTVGKGGGSISSNTVFGVDALKLNTTGSNNVAIGYQASYFQTGTSNTSLGWKALYGDSGANGVSNCAFGDSALTMNTTGTSNVAIGFQSLLNNKTGIGNTALGYQALYSDVSGNYNTAVGTTAMYNYTASGTAYANTAIGHAAMYSNVSGLYCTAVGYRASYNQIGSYNTSLGFKALLGSDTVTSNGTSNCAIGDSALEKNTSGSNNVSIGHYSLLNNTTGSNNVAIGSDSGINNKTGSNNVALGYQALYLDVSCNNNTAIGFQSLYSYNNTTDTIAPGNTSVGFQALYSNVSSRFCTAVGYQASHFQTNTYNTSLGFRALYGASGANGTSNCAFGDSALEDNTSGSNNVAVGHWSLLNNTTGSYNVSIGSDAGITNTSGVNNTYIGYNVDCTANNFSNSTAIGNGALVTASNQVRIGNTSVTSIGGQVAWSTLSDARDKTNFVPLDAGLNFINVLNPLRFDWNQRGGGLEGRKDIGFTAQELLSAQEKTKIPIPNLVDESNPDKYHVMYTQLIPILVKAVQEMSSTITRLESEINELKLKI